MLWDGVATVCKQRCKTIKSSGIESKVMRSVYKRLDLRPSFYLSANDFTVELRSNGPLMFKHQLYHFVYTLCSKGYCLALSANACLNSAKKFYT